MLDLELSGLIYTGPEITNPEILETLPSNLRNLLTQINGFVAFNGGLHLRGACPEPRWHSITEVWRGPHALHTLYPAVSTEEIPFGQDCMGDQFLLRDGLVYKLFTETGNKVSLDIDFAQFLQEAVTDPVEYLELQPLLQYLEESGPLEPGKILIAYPPFCTLEAEEGVTLTAMPALEALEYLSSLANKMGSIPEGGKIKFEIAE